MHKYHAPVVLTTGSGIDDVDLGEKGPLAVGKCGSAVGYKAEISRTVIARSVSDVAISCGGGASRAMLTTVGILSSLRA